LDHKEIGELNKNPRTIDCSIWPRKKGLGQCDALSATLFHVVLEKVIRNTETNPNGTIFNRTRQCMACAAVVLTLGQLVRAIEEAVTQTKELQ
jgi:hypothetical protein